MLKILHTAAAQISLPLDNTGFGADVIANAKLPVITKMVSGRLAGLSRIAAHGAVGKATLSRAGSTVPGVAAAAATDVVWPLGLIINPANGWEYYNRPGVASALVPILPLAVGTVFETDQYIDAAGVNTAYAVGGFLYMAGGTNHGLFASSAGAYTAVTTADSADTAAETVSIAALGKQNAPIAQILQVPSDAAGADRGLIRATIIPGW